MMSSENKTDLIVFSLTHFQSTSARTSRIMKRFATHRRVIFFETPIAGVSKTPTYFIQKNDQGVTLVQPYLPANLSVFEQKDALTQILNEVIEDEHISNYTVWTDTPKSMPLIRPLHPEFIVYDCLVDHSKTNPELEEELFRRADVVMTSGLTMNIPKVDLHYIHPSFFQPHAY